MIETAVSAEDRIRDWMREYQHREGIVQIEYAARLGISQTRLSAFIGASPVSTLGTKVARAIYNLHPELRPVIHEWLAQGGHNAPE